MRAAQITHLRQAGGHALHGLRDGLHDVGALQHGRLRRRPVRRERLRQQLLNRDTSHLMHLKRAPLLRMHAYSQTCVITEPAFH